MSIADELYDANDQIVNDLIQFRELAQHMGRGSWREVAVLEAQRAIIESAYADRFGSHDEPNAFRLALDLARAINGVTP